MWQIFLSIYPTHIYACTYTDIIACKCISTIYSYTYGNKHICTRVCKRWWGGVVFTMGVNGSDCAQCPISTNANLIIKMLLKAIIVVVRFIWWHVIGETHVTGISPIDNSITSTLPAGYDITAENVTHGESKTHSQIIVLMEPYDWTVWLTY